MDIFYYSDTGNTEFFAKQCLDYDTNKIFNIDQSNPTGPYVLLTPTYNFGKIPEPVQEFLDDHSDLIRGVVSFGNRNWDKKYAKAGVHIMEQYHVPLLAMVEMRGSKQIGQQIKQKIEKLGV